MTLADQLRATLAGPGAIPPLPHDDTLMPATVRPAAVLIAITDRPEPGVMLTVRQPHLRNHAGEIAFPGGRIDPGDADAIAAALREAEEEIGLRPADVEVVATLESYLAGSGFSITPVVGVIAPDLPLTPHEGEVAAVFEVPLAFLAETANHVHRESDFGIGPRRFFEIQWQDRRIWGITAAMIVNLSRRLAPRP